MCGLVVLGIVVATTDVVGGGLLLGCCWSELLEEWELVVVLLVLGV